MEPPVGQLASPRAGRIVAASVVATCVLAGCSTPEESTIESALTTQCPTTTVEGLDVYAGQGTIDWGQVASSGRQFAFIKATQGDYNHQSTFAANWAGAATAGLRRSAYHFFDPTKDGTAQATWFLGEIAAGGGMGSNDLPAMLDIECPVSSSQATSQSNGPNCEYTGNSGWVATATMTQRIYDWLTAVEAATGQKPIIYSYPSWFGDVGFTDAQLTAYPLFIATYGSCAKVPAPWTQAVFWQYSASGTVPGIAGNVDVDRFVGSAGDLVGFGRPSLSDAGVSGPEAGGQATGDAGGGTGGGGGGCGCRTSSGGAPTWALVIGAVVIAVRRRRRRA